MCQVAKKVAVIFQDKYSPYVDVFINHVDKLVVSYLYTLDEKSSIIEGQSVFSIMDMPQHLNEGFEYAISLSDIDEQVEGFLQQAFGENMLPVYQYDQVPELLNPLGKMNWLKCWVELNMPRHPNEYTEIGEFTYYTEPSFMSTVKDGSVVCRIGKFCSIAKGLLVLLGAEHPTSWISTYPFHSFVSGCGQGVEPCASKGDVIIGNDVWIGNGATILSGVTIGDGCVIGAKTVVTKSVDPYSVVVGNPGRVIRKRFGEDVIADLLKMKWWDWPYEHIYNVIPNLQSDNYSCVHDYWLNNVLDDPE